MDEYGSRTQKIGLIQRISRLFKRVTPENLLNLITTERETYRWEDAALFSLRSDRLGKYEDYNAMDDDIVELSSALDIHADFVTSIGEEVYSIEFDEEGKRRKEAEIVESLEARLNLKNRLWFIARNLVKYGDAFYEIVAAPYMIVKFKFLPENEIFINYDNEGRMDRDIPYIQKDLDMMKVVAEFAPWEIVHFKIGEEDYGVNYSILRRLRRTFRVLRMLEDTLIVTRVSRSNQRGVHKVDVTGMGALEAARFINRLKIINRRKRYFDSEGKLKTELDPLNQHEDVYIPVRKGGVESDYNVVGGERHLGKIEDVEHFHNKLFAGTKVPKAYLGYERDVNAKATLIQQNIAFTRVIKRSRSALATGLKQLYKVEFLLRGVDPNSFVWRIRFPALGDADEEARWQIEKLKAECVKIYGDVGVLLPIEWIVKKLFMNLTPRESEELLDMMGSLDQPKAKPAKAKTPPPPPKEPEPKKPRAEPSKEGDMQESVRGDGRGKLTESELDDILHRIEADEHLQALIRESEKAIKAKLQRQRYEYY